MRLLTEKIKKKLPKLYSTEKIPYSEKICICKFFTPWTYWTWYVVEGEEREDGDWLFFGYVEGHKKEWGYFSLSELQSVRGPFGLRIERDLYHDGDGKRFKDFHKDFRSRRENMRVSNEEVLSMTDEDWSDIISEIGYSHIPKTLSEKRRVYLDYLNGVLYGNKKVVRDDVLE